MSEINTDNLRAPFFPKNGETQGSRVEGQNKIAALKRNDLERKKSLESRTQKDAKVEINDAVKDFARIKKAVDQSAPLDKSAQIAQLKGQINAGKYEVNYDALAEKMLTQDF